MLGEFDSGTGNDSAMINPNVLDQFTVFGAGLHSIFKYLAGGIDVRDEGVAGSNPATPTNPTSRALVGRGYLHTLIKY
jgi:hypothetical protein